MIGTHRNAGVADHFCSTTSGHGRRMSVTSENGSAVGLSVPGAVITAWDKNTASGTSWANRNPGGEWRRNCAAVPEISRNSSKLGPGRPKDTCKPDSLGSRTRQRPGMPSNYQVSSSADPLSWSQSFPLAPVSVLVPW